MPSDRDDGLCGAGFLLVDRGALDSVLCHPAKGEPYVVDVDAVNDLYEGGVVKGR